MSFKDKIVALKEKEKQVIERAYAQTPVEYHGYIILLDQNAKVSNTAFDVNDELKSMGVFANNGGLYLSQQIPYMSVDGRVAMAVEEAVKNKMAIDMGKTEYFEVYGKPVCSVTVKTARGVSTGTSKVNIGGKGVDSSNPIENAETSARGRALGFLGYGTFGTGIASAEEVALAIKEQSNNISDLPKQKQDNGKKAPSNNDGQTANSKTNNQQKNGAKENKNNSPKEDPSNEPKVNPQLKSLGTYPFVLKSAKMETVEDKNYWVIAAERVGSKKTSSIYIDPKIDFPALNASEGEILDISIAQKGSVFMATDVKSSNRLGAVS